MTGRFASAAYGSALVDVPTVEGGAARFDGTASSPIHVATSGFHTTQYCTMSARFKYTNFTSFPFLFSTWGSDTSSIEFLHQGAGTVPTSCNTPTFINGLNYSLAYDTWYTMSLVVGPTTNHLFLDGALVKSQGNVPSASFITTATWIGARNGSYPFHGEIAWIAHHERMLTISDVGEFHNAPFSVFAPPRTLVWFGEASAAPTGNRRRRFLTAAG
jgi:hypothetical protein